MPQHETDTARIGDEFAVVEGPTGPAYVAWSGRGVTAFAPVPAVGSPRDFTERHPRPVRLVDAPPDRIARPLRRAVETGRLDDLPIDLSPLGTFQRSVLEACAAIPPGEVRTYGELAREIGAPRAARAVGTALGRNPIPVLIPCHRVVRADGGIGGYAYGTEMKRALLESEGVGAVDAAANAS